jgi:hypothetical protein
MAPFLRLSATFWPLAAFTSVDSMSSCAPMSLTTVPGLMTPGHLIIAGTR